MRTLRNPLINLVVFALLYTGALRFCPCSLADPAQPEIPNLAARSATASPFYPMAVGNSWSYRCSVEGEHVFDKTLRVVSAEVTEGRPYFRTELIVGADPHPLVSFVFIDNEGRVFSETRPKTGQAELIVTRDPQIGDKIGKLTVTSKEKVKTPALGTVEAIRVESFPFEQPGASEEDRMNWTGRFYARNIGLVAESDGLGGECVLSRIRLAAP